MTNDLDYLAARLHGHRSRMAEGERLTALCRLPDLDELERAVRPDAEFRPAGEFQRRLAEDLIRELAGFLKHLDGAGADLLAWMLVRFQVENIKVLLRAFLAHVPLDTAQEHLLTLPRGLALDARALATAGSLQEFMERLPAGPPRANLSAALDTHRQQPRPFFLEGALDRGFFQELLARADRLSGEDRELICPIAFQEVNAFHLMLAVRAKFDYGLAPESLLPLHVPWSRIPAGQFRAMLVAPDVRAAATLAVGRAIDTLPSARGSDETSTAVAPAELEALAWNRFLRLSNRAFRRSHTGLGVVAGYVGIRRAEVANLITLSEGMLARAPAETLRAHLRPRTGLEPAYA